MLQLSYAEVDFGGQDLVSLLSWASDSVELDGLRVGSGWAPDVPKSVLSFCHVSDQATSVFGFPTAKLGEGETRETSQVTSPSHDVPIPQWLRLQLVLQRSSAASQTQSMGQGRQGRRGSTEKVKIDRPFSHRLKSFVSVSLCIIQYYQPTLHPRDYVRI